MASSRFIKIPKVIDMVGMSKSQIYAQMADEEFPMPVKQGKRSVAWLEAEVQEWIESRIAESRKTSIEGGRMKNGNPIWEKANFMRTKLPKPDDYFNSQGLKLNGRGVWKDAICPFHNDNSPSLRVRSDNGAFRCMVCGAKGGDALAFHIQRYGMSFKEAAKQLGAWDEKR